MNFDFVVTVIFFIIIISIQYTLNKILVELKSIKQLLSKITHKR